MGQLSLVDVPNAHDERSPQAARGATMTALWRRGAASMTAPAKLNLTLRIVGRRKDGYHLLDSIVVPIDVFDTVRVRAATASTTQVSIHCDPAGAAPSGPENLAVRAAMRFLER